MSDEQIIIGLDLFEQYINFHNGNVMKYEAMVDPLVYGTLDEYTQMLKVLRKLHNGEYLHREEREFTDSNLIGYLLDTLDELLYITCPEYFTIVDIDQIITTMKFIRNSWFPDLYI